MKIDELKRKPVFRERGRLPCRSDPWVSIQDSHVPRACMTGLMCYGRGGEITTEE